MIRIYFHPRLNKIIYSYEEDGVYAVKIDNVSITFYNKKGNARTKPEVMEQSGLLREMTANPNILAGGTGDNDWDRFTAAIRIDAQDVSKARRAGLFVSEQKSGQNSTWLVRFTADQIYTLFGEYQLRRVLQERYSDSKAPVEEASKKLDVYSEKLDSALRSGEISLSDCYLITTYPSSLLSDYLAKYYGANLLYTSVGFKNIGNTVAIMLEGKASENPDFNPVRNRSSSENRLSKEIQKIANIINHAASTWLP